MEWRRSFVLFFLATSMAMGFGACGKKRPPNIATTAPGGSSSTSRTSSPPSRTTAPEPVDSGPDVRPVDENMPSGEDFSVSDPNTGEGGPLEDIHFGYDQASLSDQARALLEKHAVWLQGHRDAKVIVEGHCDERGTVEYNLALGDKRSRAAHDYLVSLGVAADRLKIVSYGKERPLDQGHDEAAWAKNRRAHFQVAR